MYIKKIWKKSSSCFWVIPIIGSRSKHQVLIFPRCDLRLNIISRVVGEWVGLNSGIMDDTPRKIQFGTLKLLVNSHWRFLMEMELMENCSQWNAWAAVRNPPTFLVCTSDVTTIIKLHFNYRLIFPLVKLF